MPSYPDLQAQARKKLQVADHMVVMTYQHVKEPKLLAAAMQGIHDAVSLSITAILEHEKETKKVPPYPQTFEAKLDVFKRGVAVREGLDPQLLHFVTELHELVRLHKKSPMEFVRQDKFVICTDDYLMRTLDLEKLKKYLVKAKTFLSATEGILRKNGRFVIA